MLIDGLGFKGAIPVSGDPGGLARDLIAKATGLGGVDVASLRDAAGQLAQDRPELSGTIRQEVSSRLSITDRALFEAAPAHVAPSATKPGDNRLTVDDHRSASSIGELNRWEAGYRDAVKANGGPFSNSPQLEAAYAHNRRQLEAATRVADREVNKLLFVGLGAPALAGAGAAMAPIAGALAGEQTVGAIGSKVAYALTSGSVGATTNVALEAGKNAAFGTDGTIGGYVGSAAGGGVGGTGIKLFGKIAPDLLNNVALGAATGAGGELIAQVVDVSTGNAVQGDGRNIVVASGIGAIASAVTPLNIKVSGLNTGRNNSVSIYEGLQTRLSSGDINGHRLRYSIAAGVGTSVTGTAQGALGTATTGVYQKVTK